ncbi:MAG: CDP-alcohol phosphatidyltransferase family protein [Tannerellaceae bacterium]|jgi:phosphatidylglycerophosphate synthase|nr:CDP-alcohol phosphatidyltransferase family protein [Tannerellaceae bacterium]
MNELNKEYEASLKSIETENLIDRVFYRPVGFRIARALRNTGVTPNMVTVISIFVGAAAGFFFYPQQPLLTLCGVLSLVLANILDCVDGQLARLTGIKSAIGRILDGIAGDIWFICVYVAFALILSERFGTYWLFVPAFMSGFSHLFQANITDYYKTVHLYFISKEKGKELHTADQIKSQYREMKPGIRRLFISAYRWYTLLQMNTTPRLQQLLHSLHERYGDDIPEDIRLKFRTQSRRLMKKYIDLLTFNGRTVVMFVVVFTGQVWIYFIYEIIVLNIVLAVSIHKHEQMCTALWNEL